MRVYRLDLAALRGGGGASAEDKRVSDRAADFSTADSGCFRRPPSPRIADGALNRARLLGLVVEKNKGWMEEELNEVFRDDDF